MIRPSPLDEAEMKCEFRRLYAEVGWDGCHQALYEMVCAANWLIAVMAEERGLDD